MAEAETPSDVGSAPEFNGRRLLYVGTGALGVVFMPVWLRWIRSEYPEVDVRAMITPSAAKFVTPTALAVMGGCPAELDTWSGGHDTSAPHVELAEWADTVIVHPATFSFVSRLALGLADTPVMLALQCTRAPVAVAPALPPGALGSVAWRDHLRALRRRHNVVVVPPHPGISMTTGRLDAAAAAPLAQVLPALELLRREVARRPDGEGTDRDAAA